MNQVILIGRLAADPELKYTPSGKAVANFRLAVDGRGREDATEFITCEAWERTAEVVAEYAPKGKQIAVTGRFKTRSWDCDRCEHKHYKTEVVAFQVELLGSKNDGAGQDGYDEPRREPVAAGRRESAPLDVDDIPF